MAELKQKANEEVAVVAQALASGKRLELLDYLAQAPRSVEELAEMSGMSVANTSRHLQILRHTGLVEVQKDGVRRIYHLAGLEVLQLLIRLQKAARSYSDRLDRMLKECLDAHESMQPITADELQQQLKKGEVLLLDVRPEKEYQQGHIPGALNVPIESLRRRLQEVPADKLIVAYCRGPYCVYAHEAVSELQRQGYRARRLEMGLPEWRAAGKPIASRSLN